MLNYNQLRVFYYAAKYENFTRASERLCVTQPAVTAQIRLLEDQCDLKLFKKRGRRLFLTDEGRTLYDYAHRIFGVGKELENAIEEMRALKRGALRLGTTKTYARYFMPFLLSSFHRKYPEIRIHLNEGSSRDMALSLLDFQNEVAVIAKAEDHPEVLYIPFSREELVLIAAPDHPFAKKKSVSFGEVASQPIIMKETGSGTRKVVNAMFERRGVEPDVLMETSNAEFIKQLVHRGEGVSFLVREAVANELREKTLAAVPVRGEKAYLDVSIAYLKGQPLSPPAKAFLEILGTLSPAELSPQGIGALMARMLARRGRGAA